MSFLMTFDPSEKQKSNWIAYENIENYRHHLKK
jgi:hypothetical protein